MSRRGFVCAVAWVLISAGLAAAEVVGFEPDADTNLFENSPDDNYGTLERLQIGLNSRGNRGRGVYRFDLASIPRGSLIKTVSLKFHVTAAGGGAVATAHDLHRIRLSWDELVTTWSLREPIAPWTIPGGKAGTDFELIASASAVFDEEGEYVFASTSGLVADVQNWIDGTAPNNGWVLISSDEATSGNTRRVGAREAGEAAPRLTIEYTPFAITHVARDAEGDFQLEWAGGVPPFAVEASSQGGSWVPAAGASIDGRTADVPALPVDSLFRVRSRMPATTARYRVELNATWSSATHPTAFPAAAHFSPLIGTTHDASVTFWQPGGLASDGIEAMAETGSTLGLIAEFQAAENVGSAGNRLGGNGFDSPGAASLEFDIDQSHSRVSLVSMIAPSPDWFVGVHDLDLFGGGRWANTITFVLDPYDAGTDGGTSYESENEDTVPRSPITRITTAPFQSGDKTRPLGTLTFTRIER